MSPKRRTPKMVRDLRAVNAGHSMFANEDLPTSKREDKRDTTPTPSRNRLSGIQQRSLTESDSEDMRYIHDSSQPGPVKRCRRRPVKPIASQLQDQCAILIEEKLFAGALEIYSNSLNAGVETDAPAYIPPPQHVALAATLTVHPKLTTKSVSTDDHAAANDALRYLTNLVSTVDVREGGMREAFRFTGTDTRNDRTNRVRARHSNPVEKEEVGESGVIRGVYAGKQSLWKSAEDFWSVVGWAFNCSVMHKARWERWRLWLELMLDVLESDLEASRDGKDVCEDEDLRPALITQYLSTIGEGRNSKRRVMRAITAHGTSGEFGEVWQHETKPPKRKAEDEEQSLLKKPKLDLDNNQYGDYFDEDREDEEAEERRRSRSAGSTRSRRSNQKDADTPGEDDSDIESEASDDDATAVQGIEAYGGIESVRLRQRFLVLLTRFSYYARNTSLFIEVDDLFDLFTEFLRPLPVAVFQQFILPTKSYFGNVNYEVGLCDMLFAPLLGTKAASSMLTQAHFENVFAPQAALKSSAADNAKVSLLTESLLRSLWREGQLKSDIQRLKQQVTLGIKAREHKVGLDGRKKSGNKASRDEEARTSLHCSSERMRVLVEMIAAA